MRAWKKHLDVLDDRSRRMVEKRHGLNGQREHYVREVAESEGLSVPRASQLTNVAVHRLRIAREQAGGPPAIAHELPELVRDKPPEIQHIRHEPKPRSDLDVILADLVAKRDEIDRQIEAVKVVQGLVRRAV